ncbi:MAG: hypothetical protein EOT04_00860 [Candidatus Chaera renei]|uniref:Uncharacterized protein n=1 Tax=Candidatus Chaera renei TaxID=2506947 RepID=A0A4Q0AKU3_9BACT|nr:MAG: hypothetical protein EOT04_00860 [Candidatus Chaera renei]
MVKLPRSRPEKSSELPLGHQLDVLLLSTDRQFQTAQFSHKTTRLDADSGEWLENHYDLAWEIDQPGQRLSESLIGYLGAALASRGRRLSLLFELQDSTSRFVEARLSGKGHFDESRFIFLQTKENSSDRAAGAVAYDQAILGWDGAAIFEFMARQLDGLRAPISQPLSLENFDTARPPAALQKTIVSVSGTNLPPSLVEKSAAGADILSFRKLSESVLSRSRQAESRASSRKDNPARKLSDLAIRMLKSPRS